MFAKTGNPFQLKPKAPVVAVGETIPQPLVVPPIARMEILTVYDRWWRADSGGVIRSVRAALAALEDMDTVTSFPSILGLKHSSLLFDANIKQRAMRTIDARLKKHIDEGFQAVESLEKSVRHLQELLSSRFSSMPTPVKRYCEAMAVAMAELIAVRKGILKRVAAVKSFNAEFDELQLFLLVLSETSENFVPSKAAAVVLHEFPGTPSTLEGIKANSGRDLFSQII